MTTMNEIVATKFAGPQVNPIVDCAYCYGPTTETLPIEYDGTEHDVCWCCYADATGMVR